MKRILCFGDSNTWGYIPGTGDFLRYDENTRWTCLLQKKLSSKAEIVEFGLCGCESGDWGEEKPFNTDAQTLFPSVFFASLPLDVAIIMLGSNDVKKFNCWASGNTARNVRELIQTAKVFSPATKIVLASAVKLDERIVSDPKYTIQAVEDSCLCAQEIERLAKEENLPFFDTNAFVKELGVDGCHFTAASHAAFADGMADFLLKMGV